MEYTVLAGHYCDLENCSRLEIENHIHYIPYCHVDTHLKRYLCFMAITSSTCDSPAQRTERIDR